jgi:hypothetical protein
MYQKMTAKLVPHCLLQEIVPQVLKVLLKEVYSAAFMVWL